jgi:chemotaxis response regulator CheB
MDTSQPCQVSPTSYVALDVVAMAASLGGVRALSRVLGALPPDFPAAVVVVQHLSPRAPSLLANILSRRTPLQVEQAMDGKEKGSGSRVKTMKDLPLSALPSSPS